MKLPYLRQHVNNHLSHRADVNKFLCSREESTKSLSPRTGSYRNAWCSIFSNLVFCNMIVIVVAYHNITHWIVDQFDG